MEEKELKEVRIRMYGAASSDSSSSSALDSDEIYALPYEGKILAGFASPAADYVAESIDINKLIIKNKDYTFIGKVEGNPMVEASLNDGDLSPQAQ